MNRKMIGTAMLVILFAGLAVSQYLSTGSVYEVASTVGVAAALAFAGVLPDLIREYKWKRGAAARAAREAAEDAIEAKYAPLHAALDAELESLAGHLIRKKKALAESMENEIDALYKK